MIGDAQRTALLLDPIEHAGRGDEQWGACCHHMGTRLCRCDHFGTTQPASTLREGARR